MANAITSGRVLITGGAGFVGRHLVNALSTTERQVRVLDSFDPQVHAGPAHLPATVEVVQADVTDPTVWPAALDGVTHVVHLAASVGVGQSMYEITNYCRANVLGTAFLLENLTRIRGSVERLVVASSMSIYGEGLYQCPGCGQSESRLRDAGSLAAREWEVPCSRCGSLLVPVPTPESKALAPTSVYAVTKRDQEELCLVTGRSFGIPTVALRFFNIYGPGQSLRNPYTGVAAIFAAAYLAGTAPTVFEDGGQTRDFIHVADIVRGCLLALESDEAPGLAVNLGTGTPTSILEVARLLNDYLGGPEPEITNTYRAGDIRHCVADTSLARQALGWEPAISLQDGIVDLVEAVRSETQVRSDLPRAVEELRSRGLLK
jgi:dTDP-L-rhamnose 4-epimerase